MAKQWLIMIAIVCSVSSVYQASASVDECSVQALRDLYKSLNSPEQLRSWNFSSGDPCKDQWAGVECFESCIIHLKLHGLGLTGMLGSELSNLKDLKHLDLSSNSIEGSIPNSLPLNVTDLNLAGNRFTQSIPSSLEQLKNLSHLNVSHNALSGPLGDVFKGLHQLREMDLSFNNFSGDLPTSFQSLTNLTKLFLQNNSFTGSVIFLGNLTLTDLNIEDNHFSGMIPEHFQSVPNLWIGGNKFDSVANYPPWTFPLAVPSGQNITSPPSTNLSAFESHPSQVSAVRNRRKSRIVGIVGTVGGLTVIAACAALFAVFRKPRVHDSTPRSLSSSDDGMGPTLPVSRVQGRNDSSKATNDSPDVSALSSSPMITPRLPPIRTRTRTSRRKDLSETKMRIAANVYTIEDLQEATKSFSEGNFLGEGSLGSVYRAELPDGQVVAVKNINTVPLSINEEEQFMDVVRVASRLRHPNIVALVGYCVEHDQHLVVYEFIRNVSVDDALHRIAYKPLSWGTRLQIALGVARALNYMHSSVPPVAHSNLKAGNILLDENLRPHICDCGLAILRSLSSNKFKLKASEMAIADRGYIAPEQSEHGINNTKADVYAFGVLLLELFTGRKPFDYSRPELEQSLVKWASFRLHDCASLGQMVDPAIAGTVTSKSLSRFADIVCMCIQPEHEFRLPMHEIVEALVQLTDNTNSVMDTTDGDTFDLSFRSTNTPLLGSPAQSYYST